MKKLYLLTLSLFTATSFLTAATTNQTALEKTTANLKQAVATNLNEVIVDILRGVRSASGEVYQASKTAIVKSVDFTMEQTPLVVQEFLKWKLTEAAIWFVVWCLVAGGAFFFAYRIKKYLEKGTAYTTDEWMGLQWVLNIAACLILIVSIGVNGMTIAKISVAPRVYLIEYVVDTIKPNQ